MTPITLTRHAEVTAILADPRYDVPTAPSAQRGVAWLRGAVSRFSRGATHVRRRALAIGVLTSVAPAELRRAAAETGDPTVVLARALGIGSPVVDAVIVISAGYFGRQSDVEGADDAVESLVAALGGAHDELTAARIGLLVQTHEATGALVAHTVRALQRERPAQPLPAVVAETLRHDPPVPTMRRQHIDEGTFVVLDLAAANRDPAVFADPGRFDAARPNLDQVLTFGSGPRACPGQDHALALALGAVEGVLARGFHHRLEV